MYLHLPKKIYKPITIISENVHGIVGTEEWDSMTVEQMKERVKELSLKGWEVHIIQVGEDQHDLDFEIWNNDRY
jgi:hypothetical protein